MKRIKDISELCVDDEIFISKKPVGGIPTLVYGIFHSYETHKIVLKNSVEKQHVYDLKTRHLHILIDKFKKFQSQPYSIHYLKNNPNSTQLSIYKIVENKLTD